MFYLFYLDFLDFQINPHFVSIYYFNQIIGSKYGHRQ